MSPRHETALIHYTGRAMINLGLDFTPRDLVDSYGPDGCHMPSEVTLTARTTAS